MKRRLLLFFVVALGMFLTAACEPPPSAPDINVTVVNTATNNTGPVTQPTPTQSPGAGAIASVRVGIFGQDGCPAGVTPPGNAARQIKVGCVAHLTATPKDAAGNDLPEAVHGQECAWSISASPGVVQVTEPGNVFNRDARGLGAGVVHFTATVRGVSGSVDVEVIP